MEIIANACCRTGSLEIQRQGKIYYCDIGDDLKTEEKLEKISQLKSISGIKFNHPPLEGGSKSEAIRGGV